MDDGFHLEVKFWGVRGSIATPTPENLGYGGNTTCLEVRSPDGILVIDAGTGVRNLGAALQQEFADSSCSLAMLLTHFHWDHIQGLPFFVPLYSPVNEITFLSSQPAAKIEDILGGQMVTPYFPVNFDVLSAKRNFVGEIAASFRFNGFEVQSFPLNHPQGATGYRLEHEGAAIVHASDFEPGDARLDRILRKHAENADVLIVDAQYTPQEYEKKRGWGHSTWLEATRIARECNVKQLVLFHHDPSHTDGDMDKIVICAQQHFENTVAAREGAVLGVKLNSRRD